MGYHLWNKIREKEASKAREQAQAVGMVWLSSKDHDWDEVQVALDAVLSCTADSKVLLSAAGFRINVAGVLTDYKRSCKECRGHGVMNLFSYIFEGGRAFYDIGLLTPAIDREPRGRDSIVNVLVRCSSCFGAGHRLKSSRIISLLRDGTGLSKDSTIKRFPIVDARALEYDTSGLILKGILASNDPAIRDNNTNGAT